MFTCAMGHVAGPNERPKRVVTEIRPVEYHITIPLPARETKGRKNDAETKVLFSRTGFETVHEALYCNKHLAEAPAEPGKQSGKPRIVPDLRPPEKPPRCRSPRHSEEMRSR